MSTNKPHFDAHCHLFNLKYLFYELAEILKSYTKGDYPNSIPEHRKDYPFSHPDSMNDLKAWLQQFAKASVRNESANFAQLETWNKEFYKDGRPFAAIPLMMDIYYLFSQPVGPNESPKPSKYQRSKILSFLYRLLGWNETYFDTLGFRHHRKELLALVKQKPAQVFPFFAVDPRRTGIVEAILKGGIIGKNLPFKGVKLYPRLGVHPQCKDLWPLYAWCEKNQIPIITHCDIIGFPPPFFEEKLKLNYGSYGSPENFAPILAKHPKLIIDFAHFGMSNQGWADQIAAFMGQYESVYSDLACYTDIVKLREFYGRQWNKPKVATKTMYGSDFDVFFAVSAGTSMQEYLESFHQVFSKEELETMSSQVPLAFLGRQ